MTSLSVFDAVVAVTLLLGAVVAGTVTHELTHAAVLHALAVPYSFVWFPVANGPKVYGAGLVTPWASVVPSSLPDDVPPWGLRLAAIAPFTMAIPFLLLPLGVVPEAAVMGNEYRLAVTIGWLACAIPSPQDFSLCWYAERVVLDELGR